jgi:His/Glu/Gln/Arg/opine family amino acid ABC transporter permease subunit
MSPYWSVLLRASEQTLILLGLSLSISTVLAIVLVPLTVGRSKVVRVVMRGYTWLGRAVPELVFLYFTFFGLSELHVSLTPMEAAVAAFVMFTTAYNIEILRGGLVGVDPGQYDAGAALGLSSRRTYLGVVLPQAIRIVLPAYLTNATIVLKNTSLASVVAVTELTSAANRLLQANPEDALKILLMAAAIYIVMCSALLATQSILARRWHVETSTVPIL